MTYEELMKRIRRMSYDAIQQLSPKDIWRLTGCFKEELVKEIVAKNSTPQSQRQAIVFLKNTRIHALQALGRILTPHPDYFEDWIFDIKTGALIESEAPTKEEVAAGISEVANMVGDKIHEFNAEQAQLQARIDKLTAQIKQVTAEKEALEKQLEECRNQPQDSEMQEELDALLSPEGARIDTDGHGAVLLELLRLLMDKDGAQWEKHGNKVIAATLMEAITGLALKTCKNHLSDPNVNQTEHQQQILEINSKLKALGMSIRL